MKMYLAAGICLAFGMLICRSSAQELQWRTRSASSSANASAGVSQVSATEPISASLGEPITVSLGAPILVPADYRDESAPPTFRPVTVRGQAFEDDSARPLPGGAPPPIIVQVPGRGSPDQVIPVAPTLMPGTGGVVSTAPCNCGGLGAGLGFAAMGDGPIVEEGGDCCGGSCCIGGGCSLRGCGLFGCGGLFSGWGTGDWGWRPGLLHGCCNDGCCAVDTCCPADGCLTACFDGCCYNGNRTFIWLTSEYLLYQFSKPNLPPLVTTGTAGTPLPTGAAGTTGPALGQAGTTVLVGPNNYEGVMHSGVRFDFGFWFPGCDRLGLDFGVLYLPQTTSLISQGSGILGRPFYDVTPTNPAPFQNTEAVNGYNGTTGTVSVNYYSRVWGFDGNLRYKLCCGPNFRIDLLAGYRNFNLVEGININENLNNGVGNTKVSDNYDANNAFNGGQFGIDAEWRFLPRRSLGGQFKLALGSVHEAVNISGSQVLSAAPNTPLGVGFFATNSNIGGYSRDQFAVLPEINLKLGVDITRNIRLFVGYNFMYLSSAVRAGDAIDTTINTATQAFGTPGVSPYRPAFAFSNSSLMTQGFSGGLDIHW